MKSSGELMLLVKLVDVFSDNFVLDFEDLGKCFSAATSQLKIAKVSMTIEQFNIEKLKFSVVARDDYCEREMTSKCWVSCKKFEIQKLF